MRKRENFKHQVLYDKICKPVDVGVFYHGRHLRDRKIIDKKRSIFSRKLDVAGIEFSIVEDMSSSRIIVSIAGVSLVEMEEAGIFREVHDLR